MAIWGFDPPEQPDLPSGAGTTLALPRTTLPVGGGEAPSERFDPSAIREPSAQLPIGETGFLGLRPDTWRKVELFSAGVQDAVDALQGKSGTALRDVLTRRSGTAREERKAKVEEERLGVERGRFTLEQIREARAIQTQQNQTFDAVVKLASEQAPKVMAIGDDKTREASINAIVEEARGRGGDRTATVVQGLLRMPQIGQLLAPLMRDLREEDAAPLRQLAVAAAAKGELDAGMQRVQQIALPITNAVLLNQMRVVSGALRPLYEGKGQKIPLVVLEAAIQAAHPEDAPGTNPQLNLLRGLGDTYSKAQERVRGNLGDLGFEVPGVAAKVTEREATKRVEAKLSGEEPERVARELFDKPLGDLSQSQTAAVNALIQQRRVDVSAQQGAAGVTARARAEEKEPIGPEGAATLISPKTLASPPTTMTVKDARERGYVKVTPEQRKDLGELSQVRTILDQIEEMSGRLIIAKTPVAAARQGIQLTAGAMSRTNAVATTYQATRQAFLGILSRQLGGERGVLTDRDIGRIEASLPNFFDTVSVREAKTGLLRELYTVADETRRSAILGEAPSTRSRERIQALLDKISGVATKAAEERLLKSLGR